ncbi:MAG TPA: hypothetical protein VN950_13235 [Terriglobales bacterium]|nr:hypothetical protein [Terriglobales bacterium]
MIWSQDARTPFLHLYAASGDTLEQISAKYFAYYRLAVTTAFASLQTLSNPLYLRLFCEANNPTRETTVNVHLGDQTTLMTLRKYLAGVRDNIAKKIDRPNGGALVEEGLRRYARELWQSDARELPLAAASQLLDGTSSESPHFKWSESITKALLDEDLVIARERGYQEPGHEVIRFTYDLLAGLIIAEGLIEGLGPRQAQSIIASGIPLLTDQQHRHPLWDDISRCLCLITPGRLGCHVYNLSSNSTLFSASVHAIFEMEPALVRPADADLIQSLLRTESNRKALLPRLRETSTVPSHPLNATFLDRVLHRMDITDRELSWTENLRQNPERFHKFLSEVWGALNALKEGDLANLERIKLAGNPNKMAASIDATSPSG